MALLWRFDRIPGCYILQEADRAGCMATGKRRTESKHLQRRGSINWSMGAYGTSLSHAFLEIRSSDVLWCCLFLLFLCSQCTVGMLTGHGLPPPVTIALPKRTTELFVALNTFDLPAIPASYGWPPFMALQAPARRHQLLQPVLHVLRALELLVPHLVLPGAEKLCALGVLGKVMPHIYKIAFHALVNGEDAHRRDSQAFEMRHKLREMLEQEVPSVCFVKYDIFHAQTAKCLGKMAQEPNQIVHATFTRQIQIVQLEQLQRTAVQCQCDSEDIVVVVQSETRKPEVLETGSAFEEAVDIVVEVVEVTR
jgi:hypothetical protein